jgi:response regulator NasT
VQDPNQRLRILLVDHDTERARLVEEGLAGLAHELLRRHTATEAFADLKRLAPDVVIVDADTPDRDLFEQIGSARSRAAVVMFVDQSDGDAGLQAVEAGVSAYVVNGLAAGRVRPIVDVAIARFRQIEALRTELEQSKTDLAERKLIERAKGLLMERRNLTEQQAFAALRTQAMKEGLKLAEVARRLLSVAELLGG